MICVLVKGSTLPPKLKFGHQVGPIFDLIAYTTQQIIHYFWVEGSKNQSQSFGFWVME